MTARGAVLPAVLVFIAAMTLSASALVVRAGSRAASGSAWLARAQSRMAAVSGIEAAAAELHNQRADLLAGEDADLTDTWTLASEGGREWVIRLLSLDEAEAVTAEAARIDVRTADDRARTSLELDSTVSSSNALSMVASSDVGLGVYEHVTSFARDPEIQGGVGGTLALAGAGTPRFDLMDGVDDGLIEEIRQRLDPTFAERFAVRARREGFGSREAFVRWLGSSGIEYEQWDELLDLVSFSGEAFVRGRVDIARAGAPVLEAALGVADATSIVSERENLRDDQRAGVVWLLENGHLSLDAFASMCDRLTYRSLQWRVRLEAGLRDEMNAASVGEIDEFGVLLDDPLGGGLLEYRTAYEAIIDVAGESPKIVWVREITLSGFEAGTTGSESAPGSADQDEYGFDEFVTDDPLYDEPLYDEPGLDESGFDEPGFDEFGFDEPAFDAFGEELP